MRISGAGWHAVRGCRSESIPRRIPEDRQDLYLVSLKLAVGCFQLNVLPAPQSRTAQAVTWMPMLSWTLRQQSLPRLTGSQPQQQQFDLNSNLISAPGSACLPCKTKQGFAAICASAQKENTKSSPVMTLLDCGTPLLFCACICHAAW